jgi:hypothetical protein
MGDVLQFRPRFDLESQKAMERALNRYPTDRQNRAFWKGQPEPDTSPCEMGQDSGDCA